MKKIFVLLNAYFSTGTIFLLFVLVGLSTSTYAQNIELEVEAWERNPDSGYVSCPWIYCCNGSDYVADNDVYSTARGANREYTDYYTLQKLLVEKNGKYSLELREDRDEHSFTDMVKLMVIDHPYGVRIGSDEAGNIGTYSDPLLPISAVLNGDFDVTGDVTAEDGIGASVYHQDAIVVNFGAVDVSQRALFVMRAIGFKVDDIQDWGDNTYQQPELQIQTLNSFDNWETKNTFYPRDDWSTGCYDLTGLFPDKNGDIKVRIHVTSCHTKKYHIIDYIGLDTSPQASIIVNTLSPTAALHSNETDILSNLVTSDGVYAEMMPGEKISMTFSIPTMSGEQRDFVFVCKGYYLPMSTGTYYIQTWNGTVWDTVYSASFITSADYVDTAQFFDMSSFLPDTDGEYKVRISQSYRKSAAGIDFVGLTKDGLAGNMISAKNLGKGWSVLDTVSASDDIRDELGWWWTDTLRTVEIEWKWGSQLKVGNFEFEGYDRNYEVYLPQDFKSNMPLVISIHGITETISWYKSYTRMHEVADTMGFIVVYPQGIGNSWNAGIVNPNRYFPNTDDVGFISRLIDTIKSKWDIDLSRVYCCGYSLGGAMSFRLVLELGHRFAAVASVSGPLFGLANSWHPIRPIPILQMHGTKDNLIPYNGEGDRWPVDSMINYWLDKNQCTLEPDTFLFPDIVPGDGCTIEKITYANCSGESKVIHYKGIGMGHSWPSSATTFGTEGNKNRDINANIEILNFFKDYQNPLVNIAFGKSVETYPEYVKPEGDTLKITATIYNPEDHPVKVFSIIEEYQDTIELFDNRLYGNGVLSDNIFSGSKWVENYDEGVYNVKLFTTDLAESLTTYCTTTNQFTVVTEIEEELNVPQVFNLEQNYPNPFNPTTKINYSIPKRSKVVIKVYDILGKEVTALVNEEKPAGNYEVQFNAANLSSGIYFYQLKAMPVGRQAGNFIYTKKMVLMK